MKLSQAGMPEEKVNNEPTHTKDEGTLSIIKSTNSENVIREYI